MAREAIELGLLSTEGATTARWQRREAPLAGADRLREAISQRCYGQPTRVDVSALISEMREEQDDALIAILGL